MCIAGVLAEVTWMAAAWRVLAGVGPEGMHIDDVSAVHGGAFALYVSVCAELRRAVWLVLAGTFPEGMYVNDVSARWNSCVALDAWCAPVCSMHWFATDSI
jgi:hypothetical protein